MDEDKLTDEEKVGRPEAVSVFLTRDTTSQWLVIESPPVHPSSRGKT